MPVDTMSSGTGAAPDPAIGTAGMDIIAAQPTELPGLDPSQNNPIQEIRAKSSECGDQRANDKNKRTRSNQRWMKLRTTVQLSGAISSTIQKSKAQLKREDSFLKRFSTRKIPEIQETLDTDERRSQGDPSTWGELRPRHPSTIVDPNANFYFHWLSLVAVAVLYNLWTLIVRQTFAELQRLAAPLWATCDHLTDLLLLLDVAVQLRTGYHEQGLVVYDSRKLARRYLRSRSFWFDLLALLPLQLLQQASAACPILRFPRFFKIYRVHNYYYMVESRTVYPNLWRVANLVHILLILAHWFGCFYYLLSEAESFQGRWVFPNKSAGYDTLTRKYLGSLYWSTLTLTTIGDLPRPETNVEFVFTIVSYLIGVFIFATIVGQVGNVITNRNANRLEFERLLDGAKIYMRHHKVPNGMKKRVLRWYDYSWARGRIQGGGDINTALGLLPDKLKTELALHVNLSVLKKVTIFQECQPEFLHDLVLKMKAFIYTPGDLICRKGEVAREMFIIADGILEVISDTGHVLTTMMEGDFFGEIGILNLDGLNKRTADVRSVGYSELFSLSREDVLAAMNDYPEAQDILQSLGRKRLMEARSMTKGTAIVEQANQVKLNTSIDTCNVDQKTDNRAKNKILERLRSNVKGLKSELSKSRPGTKNEDNLELEPLTSTHSQSENQSTTSKKGAPCPVEKRTSDEGLPSEDHQSEKPCIITKFPLLSKLKLLTEKQQGNSVPLLHGQPTSNLCQTGIDPSKGPTLENVVESKPLGAGLPLLQRLLLLKQKEDAEERVATSEASLTTTEAPLATSTVIAVEVPLPTSTIIAEEAPLPTSTVVVVETQQPTSTVIAVEVPLPTSTIIAEEAPLPTSTVVAVEVPSPTSTVVVVEAQLPTSTVVAVDPALPAATTAKRPRNCKKEVAFADEALVGRSLLITEDRKCSITGPTSISLSNKQRHTRPWHLVSRMRTVHQSQHSGNRQLRNIWTKSSMLEQGTSKSCGSGEGMVGHLSSLALCQESRAQTEVGGQRGQRSWDRSEEKKLCASVESHPLWKKDVHIDIGNTDDIRNREMVQISQSTPPIVPVTAAAAGP